MLTIVASFLLLSVTFFKTLPFHLPLLPIWSSTPPIFLLSFLYSSPTLYFLCHQPSTHNCCSLLALTHFSLLLENVFQTLVVLFPLSSISHHITTAFFLLPPIFSSILYFSFSHPLLTIADIFLPALLYSDKFLFTPFSLLLLCCSDRVKIFCVFDIVYRGQLRVKMDPQK